LGTQGKVGVFPNLFARTGIFLVSKRDTEEQG
jgi:hypothetical protein